MLTALRRHPIAMRARFEHSLVISFAFPVAVLQRLLPTGLVVDTHGDVGFAAVAVVQTRAMRPAGLPAALGGSFLLVGYRIFCRFVTPAGQRLRGLHILRSESDSRAMVVAGNLLTHYNYWLASGQLTAADRRLDVNVLSRDGEGDLSIVARLDEALMPPPGSPFASLAEARRFAGPLPFTFVGEPDDHAIVAIEGVRSRWQPRPVEVEVREASFFRSPRFGGVRPILANAFHVADVDYLWRPGVLHRVEEAAA